METRSCDRAYQLVENEHCAVHSEMYRQHAPHFRRSSSDLSLRKSADKKICSSGGSDSRWTKNNVKPDFRTGLTLFFVHLLSQPHLRKSVRFHVPGRLTTEMPFSTDDHEPPGAFSLGRRPALLSRAAAALAAAFNTPLSAITFVLEEIIEDLNNRGFLALVLIASVTSTFVCHIFLGEDPAFVLPSIGHFSGILYLLVIPTAGLAALAGVAFQKRRSDLARQN